MDRLEQIEKLRERAKVTYDEARAAYDAANGDLLEAMIILEKQGKVQPPHGGGVYSTAGQQSSEGRDYQNSEGSKQDYKQEGKDGSGRQFHEDSGTDRKVRIFNAGTTQRLRYSKITKAKPSSLSLCLLYW